MSRPKKLAVVLVCAGAVLSPFMMSTPDELVSHTALLVDFLGMHDLASRVPDYADRIAGPLSGLALLGGFVWALWPPKKQPEEVKTATANPQITYTTVNNITHIHYGSVSQVHDSAIIDAYLGKEVQIRDSANISSIEARGKDTFNIAFRSGFANDLYTVASLGGSESNFKVTHSSSASATIWFPSGPPSRLGLKFIKGYPPEVRVTTPMYRAIRRIADVIGDTDAEHFAETRLLMRQRAADGQLRILGKKQIPTTNPDMMKFSEVDSEIESDYWKVSVISEMATTDLSLPNADMWRGHKHTRAESPYSWGPKGIHEQKNYTDLKVIAADIDNFAKSLEQLNLLSESVMWVYEKVRRLPKFASYLAIYESSPTTLPSAAAQLVFNHASPRIPIYGVYPPRTVVDEIPADHAAEWRFSDDASELFDQWNPERRYKNLKVKWSDILRRTRALES
jgi:hypothetical protein